MAGGDGVAARHGQREQADDERVEQQQRPVEDRRGEDRAEAERIVRDHQRQHAGEE